jgi:hypothetical protein
MNVYCLSYLLEIIINIKEPKALPNEFTESNKLNSLSFINNSDFILLEANDIIPVPTFIINSTLVIIKNKYILKKYDKVTLLFVINSYFNFLKYKKFTIVLSSYDDLI